MQYWLVKQEPEEYSWADFARDRRTAWTGIRNFQARNNLRAMKKGDPVLFYHSGIDKKVVGIAKVAKEAYPDPSAEDANWSSVDLVPIRPFPKPPGLDTMKTDKRLAALPLLKQPRLSVMRLTREQYDRLVQLGSAARK